MKLLTVVGARPQFVKASAFSRAMAAESAGIEEVLVHTGQHYDSDMSEVFFDQLGIPRPSIELGVGSGGHGAQTGQMMAALEPHVVELRPDAVVVYGDTNSTLAGALVAAKLHIPIVHIEAGLRSFNREMPEEINRVVTDHLANLLLCPSEAAVDHLRSEGIVEGVHQIGDLMLDVMLHELARLDSTNPVLERLGLGSKPVLLLTMHRPSNVDHPQQLHRLLEAVRHTADRGFDIVWPVHPRVRGRLGEWRADGVHTVSPLSYDETLKCLRDAAAVVTDSGGLQKEAFWMRRPCLTLRHETEWVETVDSGWNRLLGAAPELLPEAVVGAVDHPPTDHPTPYGDGTAAIAAVRAVMEMLT